jgi:hypothetical protein
LSGALARKPHSKRPDWRGLSHPGLFVLCRPGRESPCVCYRCR